MISVGMAEVFLADLIALGHDDEVHGSPLRAHAKWPLEGQEGGSLALFRGYPQDRRHQVPELTRRHLPNQGQGNNRPAKRRQEARRVSATSRSPCCDERFEHARALITCRHVTATAPINSQ
jgi:hypothetical protein